MAPSPTDSPAPSSIPSGPFHGTAKNYAPHSENAIHQDDFAKQYDFAGGLVPGVGVYSLMTGPFARHWGAAWLDAGWLEAKFIQPVYDGERLEIVLRSPESGSPGIPVEVFNPRGKLCAVGRGGLRPDSLSAPASVDFPRKPLPGKDDRLPPVASELQPGLVLGSLPVVSDPGIGEDLYFEQLRDSLPIYREPPGRLHPGFLPHIANRLVHRNIAVGPWIHTESRVTHFAPVRPQGTYEMRGRLREAFQKRGHEYVRLDLAVFDAQDVAVAQLEHVAIVKPRLETPDDSR